MVYLESKYIKNTIMKKGQPYNPQKLNNQFPEHLK